jgi:hypothetical protein
MAPMSDVYDKLSITQHGLNIPKNRQLIALQVQFKPMNLRTFAMDRCEQDVSLQNKYRSFAHNTKPPWLVPLWTWASDEDTPLPLYSLKVAKPV